MTPEDWIRLANESAESLRAYTEANAEAAVVLDELVAAVKAGS